MYRLLQNRVIATALLTRAPATSACAAPSVQASSPIEGASVPLGPNYSAEVSYLRGRVVSSGTPGSVRADAIVGPTQHPLFAIELKTGGAYISRDDYNKYQSNLPPGTLLQEIIVP